MIICAAVKFHMLNENLGDEQGDIVITGWRHANCFETLKDLGFKPGEFKIIEQGFINNNNVFLNRIDAYQEAINCGQLSAVTRWQKGLRKEDELFSEDLY